MDKMRRYCVGTHALLAAKPVSLDNVWMDCLIPPLMRVCGCHLSKEALIMALELTSNSASERRWGAGCIVTTTCVFRSKGNAEVEGWEW